MGDVLPVDAALPEVIAALRAGGAVVLRAPTGSGKTTRVPPALLDAGYRRVVMLEPRRVAARAAAARIAEERGGRVGDEVGFQVRHERVGGPGTRLWVVTEGVLLARLVEDPFLEDVDAVVLDEFHERSVDADLCLALLARLRAEVRPELAIVVMSATMDAAPVADFLGAPVVDALGRTYPVEVRYLARAEEGSPGALVARHVPALLAETGGDVLAFLPGVGEIDEAYARLADVDAERVPLHGRLPPAAQQAALRPGKRPRVVLATNVAETSVTLPGVRAVIDAGWVRVSRYDARRGLDALLLEPNSRASADQRAGRAGRVGPGIALRLWPERSHGARPASDDPEVRRADLSGAVLALAAWGEPDAARFPWFEAPPADALAAARRLLVALGLLETSGGLTSLGRAAARMGTHPRLATALLRGHALGVEDEICEAVALLEARAPVRRVSPPRAPARSDLLAQAAALRGDGDGLVLRHPGAAAEVGQLADQHRRRLRRVAGAPGPRGVEGVSLALAAAWPDRVAVRREPGSDRFRLANGRGARLSRDSAVVQEDLVVALDVSDGDDAHAQIHLAVALDRAVLPTHRVQVATWDVAADRVQTADEVRYGDLVLERRLGAPVPTAVVEAALAAACRADPRRFVPLADEAFAAWVARVRFAARRHPEAAWPDVSLEGLASLAEGLVAGCRSLAALKSADWVGALRDALGWTAVQRLDVIAPSHLPVGVGRRAPLHYPLEGPPELSVRMQDLFGVRETPKVDGEPVSLHLLAPNGRPVQVTRDLLGFWTRTWPEVRKELRARYPKHSWPDDPLAAAPPAPRSRPPT